MRTTKLEEMTRGWFIGDFEPSLFKTQAFEAAVKTYKAGDREEKHFHKVATEYTVVVEGSVEMFGKKFIKGDIVVVEPGEATAFTALQDTVCAVIKIPGAKEDKYLSDNREGGDTPC